MRLQPLDVHSSLHHAHTLSLNAKSGVENSVQILNYFFLKHLTSRMVVLHAVGPEPGAPTVERGATARIYLKYTAVRSFGVHSFGDQLLRL